MSKKSSPVKKEKQEVLPFTSLGRYCSECGQMIMKTYSYLRFMESLKLIAEHISATIRKTSLNAL